MIGFSSIHINQILCEVVKLITDKDPEKIIGNTPSKNNKLRIKPSLC